VKAERFFTILNILLNKRKISAPKLARHVNVSVGTIYRDIDALSLAGIPVFTTTGRERNNQHNSLFSDYMLEFSINIPCFKYFCL